MFSSYAECKMVDISAAAPATGDTLSGVAGPDQCDQCDHQCHSVTLAAWSPNKQDCYNAAWSPNKKPICMALISLKTVLNTF